MEAKKIRRGLALEGGGARGSYHMGVCKAYLERGYEFDGFVGTSIGAINAAMLASGGFEKALELWESIELDQLFDQEYLDALKLDKNSPTSLRTAVKKLFVDRGVDHSKIKKFLASYIIEEKVRASGCDFGLVTFSINELKPYEIFLKDIPEGQLIDYVFASAKFLLLAAQKIDDNRFFDGGIYNSCPINMLIDQEYDEIIAVRTPGFQFFRRYDKSANVTLIEPKEGLGHFLSFGAENSRVNIKRGYCDAVRILDGLVGDDYYLEDDGLTSLVSKMLLLGEAVLGSISYFQNKSQDKRRVLLEQAIPEIADFLDLDKNFTYEQFVLAVLEFVAIRKEIERFEVYNINAFCKLIKETPTPKSENILSKVGLKVSFDFFEKKSILIEEIAKLLI